MTTMPTIYTPEHTPNAINFMSLAFSIRLAQEHDIPALEVLIPLSARVLLAPFYSPAQMEAALGPVVRCFESKFPKAATGSIRSKGVIPADTIDNFISTPRSGDRATIDIAVEIYGESAACILSATVGWFVATRSAAPMPDHS